MQILEHGENIVETAQGCAIISLGINTLIANVLVIIHRKKLIDSYSKVTFSDSLNVTFEYESISFSMNIYNSEKYE